MTAPRRYAHAGLLSAIDDIDLLWSGGWSLPRDRGGYLIKAKDGIARHKPGSGRGSHSISTGRISAIFPRVIRVTAPAPPPTARGDGLKHFGLIHTNIYKERGKRHASERAVYIEAGGAQDGIISEEARSTNVARYAEGHASNDRERVVWVESNIDSTFEGRVDFWRKVTTNARFTGDATVTVDVAGREAEWAAIGPENMVSDVRRAYEAAVVSAGRATIVVNSADPAWRYSRSREHRELFEQSLKVQRQPNELTMCSVIVALPHVLSAKGMSDLASDYTSFFASRKLPYQAVIHAPVDGKNDSRNWHMHINYYPFPVSKAENGKWSFEREEYYSETSRKMRTRKIANVNRLEETKPGNDWLPKMKAHMAAAANRALEAEGQRAYFTLLTNAQRGRGVAERRRGPKASALRARGELDDQDLAATREQWRRLAQEDASRRAAYLEHAISMRLARVPSARSEPLLERAREAGALRAIMVLADWKAKEISSGLDLVETEQRGAKRRAKASPVGEGERISPELLLSICAEARFQEVDLHGRLRNIKAEARRLYRKAVLDLNTDVAAAQARWDGLGLELDRHPQIEISPSSAPPTRLSEERNGRQRNYAAAIAAGLSL